MTRQAPSIIPSMRYRDARAAIEWLCRVLGFAEHLVVPGDSGTILHAQLTLGNGMIMLGSVREGDVSDGIKPPVELGGGSAATYVVVSDIDAHYARATAEGATILAELYEPEHGGKLYGCKDPEGHQWYFGSYDPWADPA